MLVFPDTTDKRNNESAGDGGRNSDPQRMTVQEAQELASGVQQIMELRHIAVDAGRARDFSSATRSIKSSRRAV